MTVNTGLAEKIPRSDGFDYPVGKPDGKSGENGYGYYVIAGLGDLTHEGIPHLGEDWNSAIPGCGTCDLGDPIYAISNGYVRYAHDTKMSEWKGIIIIDHQSEPGLKFHNPNGGELIRVTSMYAHLDVNRINEWVNDGDYVNRGQQIGVIGPTPTGSTGPHLHFEIRSDVSKEIGPGYSTNTNGWLDPRSFIDANRPQITPLIGNWSNDQKDENGTFDPDTSIFSWINSPMGEPGDIPLVGDWDGDKKATIGIYRPRTAEFHLDNDNNGRIDQKFTYGEIGDFPIVGDWDGNGYDEVGVFREIDPTSQKTTFYLRNSRIPFVYFGMQNDTPVIGDWNKDKKDDIGVFRRYSKDPGHNNNAVFFINYTFRGEQKEGKDPYFLYGLNSDIPIAGKWDDDGLTKIGVFRPSTKEFHFNHTPLISVSNNDIFSIFDKLRQMGEETINNIKNFLSSTSNAPSQDMVDTPDSTEPSAPTVSIIDQIKSWIEENVPILSTSPAAKPTPTQKAEASKLSGKTIIIDPGHKSTETDRVNSGEYEITHKIGPILQALLIQDGATVYLTDVMGDTKEPGITERANFAISKKPDLFLSIHTNAAVQTARGVEVWLWEGNDKTEFREKELADLIYKNVIEQTEQPSSRGIKEKNNPWDGSPDNNHIGIPILSDYTYPSPAVLVELDFTTYSSQVTFKGKTYDNMRQLMKSSEYQNSAANALRIAIEQYFKVSTTPLPDLYASIRAVFGQDWQPAPIFLSSGIVNQGVYGAVNINGGIDVYTIGPGGMKETPESYYQKFGTYDQNGIVGTVTIDQARRLGINV